MTVEDVDFRGRVAQTVRRLIGRSLHRHIETQQDDMCGYVLVTWDRKGDCMSSFSTDSGPIGESLMPSYVKDALNRHLAVMISQRSTSEHIDGA